MFRVTCRRRVKKNFIKILAKILEAFLGPFSRFAQGKEKAKVGGKKGPFELPSS